MWFHCESGLAGTQTQVEPKIYVLNVGQPACGQVMPALDRDRLGLRQEGMGLRSSEWCYSLPKFEPEVGSNSFGLHRIWARSLLVSTNQQLRFFQPSLSDYRMLKSAIHRNLLFSEFYQLGGQFGYPCRPAYPGPVHILVKVPACRTVGLSTMKNK